MIEMDDVISQLAKYGKSQAEIARIIEIPLQRVQACLGAPKRK